MSRFLKSSILLAFANGFTGLMGYVAVVWISHLAGPLTLTTVITVTGFAAVWMIPASLWTLPVTVWVAREQCSRKGWLRGQAFAVGAGILAAGTLWLASGPLDHALRLGDPSLLLIILPWVVVAYPIGYNTGVLQGSRRFGWLGLITALPSLFKVLLIPLVAWTHSGAPGYVALNALGALGATVLLYILVSGFIRRWPQETTSGSPLIRIEEWLPAGLLAAAVTSWTYGDILIARQVLPPSQATVYIALSTLGKLPFFLLGSTAGVLVSLTAGHQEQGKMFTGTAWIMGAGGVFLLFMSLWGSKVLRVTTTLTPGIAPGVMVLYAGGAVLMAWSYMAAGEMVACGEKWGWLPLMTTAGIWAGVAWIAHMGLFLLVVSWFTALTVAAMGTSGLLLLTRMEKRRQQVGGGEPVAALDR